MSESESETPQIDDSTTKLIQKIVNDPSLAKKLGLFLSQDEGSKGIKRKDTGSHSPVKLKQVKSLIPMSLQISLQISMIQNPKILISHHYHQK